MPRHPLEPKPHSPFPSLRRAEISALCSLLSATRSLFSASISRFFHVTVSSSNFPSCKPLTAHFYLEILFAFTRRTKPFWCAVREAFRKVHHHSKSLKSHINILCVILTVLTDLYRVHRVLPSVALGALS